MRIRHRLTATLCASSIVTAGFSQSTFGQSTWSQTYGGAVSEQGLKDLEQLPGGRLVAAGYTASFGGPTQASWLLNLDLGTGDVGVERVSTSSFGGFTDGAKVAADGGALFLGRDVLDIFHKHDAWLMRVDQSGLVDWSLGFTRVGNGRHFLFDAAELDDGSWIAVGATGILDEPPQAAWVVRVSSTGDLLWQYEYGGGIVETASSVTTTSDGGFAVAGWTNSSGDGFDDIWIMKIDAAGVIQWQKTYGAKESEQAREIIELADGGFAVAGSTNSLTPSGHAPWILRLDATGSLLWHKVVASDVWGDLEGVAQANDGDLVVVGRVAELGFPTNDLWSAKLSTKDGSVSRQHAYEGDTGDFGSVVLPLECNGYVLGGTWGWGFAEESIWLQRTNDDGELSGCDIVRTTSFALSSPPITEAPGIVTRVAGGAQVKAPGEFVAVSSAVVTEVCDRGVALLEVPRAGSPPNPSAFLAGVTSGPIVGQTWDPVIDHAAFVTDSISDFAIITGASFNLDLGQPSPGTLLCDVTSPLLVLATAPAPGAPFAFPVPANCPLVGVEVCAQAGSIDSGFQPHLTNAIDLTIGSL